MMSSHGYVFMPMSCNLSAHPSRKTNQLVVITLDCADCQLCVSVFMELEND
jgi:hypothetical protein